MSKLTKNELEIEKIRSRDRRNLYIFKFCSQAFPWLCFTVMAYFAKVSVESLAGKTTLADLGVNAFFGIDYKQVIAYSVAGRCFLLYRSEKRLRKETTERLTNRVTGLELKIDPSRTSSEITPSGDTNPRDRI